MIAAQSMFAQPAFADDCAPDIISMYNDKVFEMQMAASTLQRAASDYEWTHPQSAGDVFLKVGAFITATYFLNQQINQKMNEIDFSEL